MSAITLSTLPPSVLSEITCWLDFGSVIKLTVLCGNYVLRSKFAAYGGVTELRVETEEAAGWFRFSWEQMLSFKLLTSIHLDYEGEPEFDFRKIRCGRASCPPRCKKLFSKGRACLIRGLSL